MSEFTPFTDDVSAATVDGLTIENGAASVSVFGSLEITRDEAGLERARRLRTLLDSVVAAIMEMPPAERAAAEPTVEIANPFA